MKVGRLLIKYDESEFLETEIKYRLENKEEFYENATSEEINEEYIQNDVYENSDILNFYWEDVEQYLTEILEKKNPDGYWKIDVENFGWRNLDGTAYLRLEKGVDIVHKVLPRCPCSFKVYNYGKGLAIQNWHHDSPTGNEWYFLRLAFKKEIEEETFK